MSAVAMDASATVGGNIQLVSFDLDGETFALPMESVLEIIRVPPAVRVPLTGDALLGLANLRGLVLPILETRRLMGLPSQERTDATRVVVADCGSPVGLVVDRVDRVMTVSASSVESARDVTGEDTDGLVTGVVRTGDEHVLQLLDVDRVVGGGFHALVARAERSQSQGARTDTARRVDIDVADESIQLVSFSIDGEEYGFPINEVSEIVRVPDAVRRVPGAAAHLLGLISLRQTLLPLVDLRSMFGVSTLDREDGQRVLVTVATPERPAIGVLVDAVREVLRVPTSRVDPLPELLARGRQEQITGVCRLDGGRRLVSVLSTPALFEDQVIRAGVEAASTAAQEESMQIAVETTQAAERQVVVFRMGDEEYGAALEAVAEIIRVPKTLTRMPKSPDFIDGLFDLRGAVLPAVDLRSRFGLPRIARTDKHRILVLELGGLRTGFIVDAVTEVLRISEAHIETPPEMSGEQRRMIPEVASLRETKRMLLLIDVDQLLSKGEQAALAEPA